MLIANTANPRLRSNRLFQCSAVFLLACTIGGCRHVDALPIAQDLRSESFCLLKHAQDVRNFDRLIAKSLKERGFNVSRSTDGACPDDADYVVAYFDHFFWDMRVFLAKLTIEVRDAETDEILAYGESMQDSLGALGTSYQDVIDRALVALLNEEAQ